MKDEAPLGNPFIGEPRGGWPAREVAGRPTHVAKAPPLFPKVVVVEVKEIVEEKREKEGGDGQPAKLWHQFSSTFHHPPHLDPLMLKPLTKSIKSKANSFHLCSKFFISF
jgi:hypothetical protein